MDHTVRNAFRLNLQTNFRMVIDAYNLLTKIIKLEKSKADKQKMKMKQIGQVYPNKPEHSNQTHALACQSQAHAQVRPRSRDSRMPSHEDQRAQTPNVHRVAPTITAHTSANIRYEIGGVMRKLYWPPNW